MWNMRYYHRFTAIAAIRATEQVTVNQHGQSFKALRGVRSRDEQRVTLYPELCR